MQDDENTDLTPFWQLIFKEIEDTRKSAGRALLLCAMGISRSATFAIGYLLCIEKLSLRESYKHVQMCRNIICPNVGFFQQLIDLEKKIHSTTSVTILEPIKGVKVADVVWQELYEEMMETMSEADRHSLRSLNTNIESARLSSDIRSVRSLNVISENRVDDLSQSIGNCRLSEAGASTALLGPVPLQRARTEPPINVIPKSALKDKSKSNEKKKKWRLSFSKDVR
ncbi:hypothetical protein WR25_20250 isoform D [Diploscapter pachys]|nr:hypothetical protein WR25_20250 isoform C [Diploscapter pachys]PAV87969.1 hypothetical protein WR25_20250 isoform D [Diploscapter pachys]